MRRKFDSKSRSQENTCCLKLDDIYQRSEWYRNLKCLLKPNVLAQIERVGSDLTTLLARIKTCWLKRSEWYINAARVGSNRTCWLRHNDVVGSNQNVLAQT